MSGLGEAPRCAQQLQAAAYVLGALPSEEARRYRAHLQECATCCGEVADLRPVVDALEMSAPEAAAPTRLRERVMAIVRSEADPAPQADPAERPATGRRGRSARGRSGDGER